MRSEKSHPRLGPFLITFPNFCSCTRQLDCENETLQLFLISYPTETRLIDKYGEKKKVLMVVNEDYHQWKQ